MRKSILFVLGLVVMVASLAAQTHDNMKESPAKDDVVFDSAVRVGNVMLPAGEYRISCDREIVTFTRISDHKKMIETKCKGKDLGQKADETIALTNLDRTGMRYLDKLKLRGSTVEHTFN